MGNDRKPLTNVRRFFAAAVIVALSIGLPASPSAAGGSETCGELDGRHIVVSGILGGVDELQEEPGAVMQYHFDLLQPDWDSAQRQVAVISYGVPVFCLEGDNLRVAGTHLCCSPTFPWFSVIEVAEVDGIKRH